MRELTKKEIKSLFKKGRCPFCKSRELVSGPTGGMAENIYCADCKAGFNVVPGFPELHGQLIQEPQK